MDSQWRRNVPFISYFDLSPAGFAWREPRFEQIEQRRALLGDLLIFDIILASGGIRDPDTLYPPQDQAGLQRLLDAIENSHYDVLKKDCLVYFLLKWHQDGREEKFQEERCIPPQFAALANAYWHLDCGANVPRAVSILADPRLNRDYVSKILQAISLYPDSPFLIRKYIQTAKPPLTEPDDLDIYTLALADSSLTEAWRYQRTFNEGDPTRSRLFQKMLESCVIPQPRPASLTQLLSLPLSPYEQTLLYLYALEPPSSLPIPAIAILQDLVCVRLIQAGKYAQAIKIDRKFTSSTSPKHSMHMQDRIKMIQDLYNALPATERALLDAELEFPVEDKNSAQGPSSSNDNAQRDKDFNMSLSQSWEDVQMPPAPAPNISLNTLAASRSLPEHIPTLSVSERSGAPRFGGASANKSLPTIPVAQSANLSGSTSSQKNFALHPIPPSNAALRSSNPTLSGAATRLSMGSQGISSPVSGMRFPLSNTRPTSHASTSANANGFTSASRQHNAFYQPPAPKAKDTIRIFDPIVPQTMASGDEDKSMEVDNGASNLKGTTNRPSRVVSDEEDELGFSVFGGGEPVTEKRAPLESAPRKASRTRSSKTDRKMPPGAFLTDEDTPMEPEDHEDDKQIKSASRQTSVPKRKAAATTPKRKGNKEQELKRSLPGSLMDDVDEDDDIVPPLPTPSSPPTKRPFRRARSLTPSDVGDETEGVMTRRRSSRLSTTSATETKTKKTTRGVARKKR